MRFPFSLSRTIILDQKCYRITSEAYLLNHVEEYLEYLDMSATRIDNQLLLEKLDFIRGFRQKDFIRSLLVTIEIDSTHIRINLKTPTVILFLLGLIPVICSICGVFPPSTPLLAVFIWLINFIPKFIILSTVKSNLEHALASLSSS